MYAVRRVSVCVCVCVCLGGDGSTPASETVRSLLEKECEETQERLKKIEHVYRKKGAFVEGKVKLKSEANFQSVMKVEVL